MAPRSGVDSRRVKPPKSDRDESPIAAILTDDESGSTSAPAVPKGGPRFAGSRPVTAPIGRPGRRAAAAADASLPLGTFVPVSELPASVRMRKARRARMVRRLVVRIAVVAVLGAGAYVAYPHVRAVIRDRSVPADLRAYVGGTGVTYAPAGQGYSVRLPAQPHPRDGAQTSIDGARSMFVHRSIVAGGEYQIVVRVDDQPNTGGFPRDLSRALRDTFFSGVGTPTNVRSVVIAGEAAYEGDVHLPATVPFKIAILEHGGRLYVIRVESRSPGTVFDAVAQSFRFTN